MIIQREDAKPLKVNRAQQLNDEDDGAVRNDAKMFQKIDKMKSRMKRFDADRCDDADLVPIDVMMPI